MNSYRFSFSFSNINLLKKKQNCFTIMVHKLINHSKSATYTLRALYTYWTYCLMWDVRDMQATSAGQVVMGNRFKINYILSVIIGKTELIVDQL
jgi:hypothetical protein